MQLAARQAVAASGGEAEYEGSEATPIFPGSAPSRVIWLGVLALLIIEVAARDIVDLDAFHEMALFREILAIGKVPLTDVFAYTPTVSPIVHHEWATGAALYLSAVTSGLGLTGLVFLRYVLVLATALACAATARMRGAQDVVAVLLAPLAIYMFVPSASPVRAQLFSLLLLSFLLLALELDRRGGRYWIIPWLALFVIWVNLHAGFLVGAGLLGVYAAESFGRRWSEGFSIADALASIGHLIGVIAAMACLVVANPYGFAYVPYLWRAVRLDRPLVHEWAPLWAAGWRGSLLILVSMTLLFVAYAIFKNRGIRALHGISLVLTTAIFALLHARHVSLYAVVWFAYVPAYLTGTDFGAMLRVWCNKHAVRLTTSLIFLPTVLAAKSIGDANFLNLRIPTSHSDEGKLFYPAGAVDYLDQQKFTGNLMTPFNQGAFVSWYLYPAVRVGMDSRYEVAYPPEAAEDNFRLYTGHENWERILLSYSGTDAVLVPRTSPLDSLLVCCSEERRWSRIYRDEGFSVFVSEQWARKLEPVSRSSGPIETWFP